MMKEIHEQPKAVQDTLNSVIKNGAIDLSSVEITEDEICLLYTSWITKKIILLLGRLCHSDFDCFDEG